MSLRDLLVRLRERVRRAETSAWTFAPCAFVPLHTQVASPPTLLSLGRKNKHFRLTLNELF